MMFKNVFVFFKFCSFFMVQFQLTEVFKDHFYLPSYLKHNLFYILFIYYFFKYGNLQSILKKFDLKLFY